MVAIRLARKARGPDRLDESASDLVFSAVPDQA
jgi:hypothetical protein